jgi:putative transcriptional regulator
MEGCIMGWFGLGKPRSKLGRYIDKHEITQVDLSKKSGVSRTTIGNLCSNDGFEPNMRTAKKIVRALRELTGKNVDYDDFWSM